VRAGELDAGGFDPPAKPPHQRQGGISVFSTDIGETS
jgi:hypothetical protein